MKTRWPWPTAQELQELQDIEDKRAEEQNDIADPICDCGQPGFACKCEELSKLDWHEVLPLVRRPSVPRPSEDQTRFGSAVRQLDMS